MSLVLSVRFPHRRYHATAWDQAANNGQVEWPPSPWRLTRALLAVGLTRHPELSTDAVVDAVRLLGAPPTYYVPPTRPGHTRHYLPKITQRTGNNDTELTLDSYVSIDPADALVIAWPDAEPTEQQLSILTDLFRSLPYLGRAESLVDASLVTTMPDPDAWHGTVWRPHPQGMQRLLCPTPEATLDQLHTTTHQMRKARRLVPEGAQWQSYEERDPAPERVFLGSAGAAPADLPSSDTGVAIMRWRFESPAPFEAVNAIQATARLRGLVMRETKPAGQREDAASDDLAAPEPIAGRDAELISGHVSDPDRQHSHAHWLWLDAGGRLTDLVLWVPAALSDETARRIQKAVYRFGLSMRPGDYVPPGFVPGDLNLAGWGGADHVVDLMDLTTPGADGTIWRSATPHLIGRLGKKNQSLESLALEHVRRELSFRVENPPAITSLTLEERPADGRPVPASRYRQRHWGHRFRKGQRNVPAVWLRVEFDRPLPLQILTLGPQSHFGFGRLVPTAH